MSDLQRTFWVHGREFARAYTQAPLFAEQVAAMPRFHHQYLPDTIVTEPGALSPEAVLALQAMGHAFDAKAEPWTSFLHAVEWNHLDNSLRGGADPRNPTGSAKVSKLKQEAVR